MGSDRRPAEDTARRREGGPPTGAASVRPWAEAVAGKKADTDSGLSAAALGAMGKRLAYRLNVD